VLLKNTVGALPLTNIKTIGIIGNGAGPAARGPNGYVEWGVECQESTDSYFLDFRTVKEMMAS
jgi:hypothetical protein